jgi:hypothetical protein
MCGSMSRTLATSGIPPLKTRLGSPRLMHPSNGDNAQSNVMSVEIEPSLSNASNIARLSKQETNGSAFLVMQLLLTEKYLS